jgi:hypothetical protein
LVLDGSADQRADAGGGSIPEPSTWAMAIAGDARSARAAQQRTRRGKTGTGTRLAVLFRRRGEADRVGDRRRYLFDRYRRRPDFPGQVETIDIILSVDYARAVIAQLSTAVIAAQRNEDCR